MISREILSDVDPEIAAVFDRLLVAIDNELSKSNDIKKYSKMPPKLLDGRLYYFTTTISPDITSTGLWFYKDGTWANIA